jgi:hypothetical protein
LNNGKSAILLNTIWRASNRCLTLN